MSRVTAALTICIICGLGVAPGAAAGFRVVQLASDAEKNTPAAASPRTREPEAGITKAKKSHGADTGKPARAPARQVPVEPLDEPVAHAAGESSRETKKGSGDASEPGTAAAASSGKSGEKTPATATQANTGAGETAGGTASGGLSNAGTGTARASRKPKSSGDSVSSGEPGPNQSARPAAGKKTAGRAAPGLPLRKPNKPVVRVQSASKKAEKKEPLPRGQRDKRLCQALQACRNTFIVCKSKIKHPDQSPAWSAAKEECGARYKACVEKDFRPGEWFFTRWFYFQELDCG